MNAKNKQELKDLMGIYPKIKECINNEDWDTLWKGFGLYKCKGINPFWGCPNMTFRPFLGCLLLNALSTLEINCHLKKIPEYFAGCETCEWHLDEIIIPDGVEIIGEGAFWNCANATTIKIPNSVTSIGADAFLIERNKKNRTVIIPERFKDELDSIGIDSETDNIKYI